MYGTFSIICENPEKATPFFKNFAGSRASTFSLFFRHNSAIVGRERKGMAGSSGDIFSRIRHAYT
jgi:hypothetical protein